MERCQEAVSGRKELNSRNGALEKDFVFSHVTRGMEVRRQLSVS